MDDKQEIAEGLMDLLQRFKKSSFHIKCNTDLTPGQIGMLHIIYHNVASDNIGISVRQLSELSRQTPSGVTQTINFLENRQLVTRTTDPDDRRIIRVRLTEEGLELVEEHHNNLMKMSYGLIEDLGKEKILIFMDILNDMIKFGERMNKKDD